MSYVHVWRQLTGGGLPVDYLRWLSAMWEQYVHDPSTHVAGETWYITEQRLRFHEWMRGKFHALQ